MSNGIKFNENYSDFWADIHVMGRYLAMGWDFKDFVTSLQKEGPPGEKFHYKSTDTQVIGYVVEAAYNRSLSELLEEKIWKKIGPECDIFWLLDNDISKKELSFGTINTCVRDFARFGWLFLNKGKSPLNNEQLISEKWIEDSTKTTEKYLMHGNVNKHYSAGYGYHWWVPGNFGNNDEGDFFGNWSV